MSKFNPSGPSLSLHRGNTITKHGNYLGRSRYEKDCYWACYEYDGELFLALNGDSDMVYEADEDDIKLYCEVG